MSGIDMPRSKIEHGQSLAEPYKQVEKRSPPEAAARRGEYAMQPAKNPGVAAVLSFFFTGLGQIYNGRLLKGLVFMAAGALNIALMFILIGFLTGPLFWIYNIYDAYSDAERINRSNTTPPEKIQPRPDWGQRPQLEPHTRSSEDRLES
jgi:TM2 domain-containing membrane protein YozV